MSRFLSGQWPYLVISALLMTVSAWMLIRPHVALGPGDMAVFPGGAREPDGSTLIVVRPSAVRQIADLYGVPRRAAVTIHGKCKGE